MKIFEFHDGLEAEVIGMPLHAQTSYTVTLICCHGFCDEIQPPALAVLSTTAGRNSNGETFCFFVLKVDASPPSSNRFCNQLNGLHDNCHCVG